MRVLLGAVTMFAAFAAFGCSAINVQQQAGFARADIRPTAIPAKVGDIVQFSLLPPVSRGTEWDLETFNRARFPGDPPEEHLFWVAEHEPVHLEAIVAPWDPKTPEEQRQAQGWLWFALRDSGSTEPLRRPLPIRRAPYKELAPVAAASGFSIRDRAERLTYARANERHELVFKTTTDMGTPALPQVRSALVETEGKRILYAEIKVNFGEVRKETVSYETTLSYPLSVAGPVEVVVVEWVGHGTYFRPFQVYRVTTPG
jgi:hypothetical protein